MKIYLIKDIAEFDENFIKICSSFFPKWRKDQMIRYKSLNGQVQNALAYLLLVYALINEGIMKELPEFCYNEHNKPLLKNYTGWNFNISHTKNAVCCVLSKMPIGIDIETIGEYKESLARYISNDQEFMLLSNSESQADDFYRLWTQKEAVFKCIGTGITGDIKNILTNDNFEIVSEKIDNMWISIAY